MKMLKLITPSADYAGQIAAYRQEFLDTGSSMDGTGPLRRFADPQEWLAHTALFTDPATVPEGKVPATQLLGIREADNRLVGMLQIRHSLNDYLRQYSGHIGYSVRPSERRKGYAKEMLRQALPYCRELGLERVMIACIDTNEASRRTILANGGVYDKTVFEPEEQVNLEQYWIVLDDIR